MTKGAGVSDVISALVKGALVRETTVAGFRVGNRFLSRGVSLTRPWYHDHDELVLVTWGGDGCDCATTPETRLLTVSGGHDAGRVFPLPMGEFSVGRHRECALRLASVSVSARHGEIRVDAGGNVSVRDLGSTNGTFVGGHRVFELPVAVPPGGTVHFGACPVTLSRGPTITSGVGPVETDGRRAFYRSAQPLGAPVPEVVVPNLPADPGRKPKFNWLGFLAPLLMAGVLSVFFGPAMAAFAVLGAVMSLGTFVQDRSRLRSQRCEANALATRSLSELAVAIALQQGADVARFEHSCPDPGVVLARSSGPGPDLWNRRVDQFDKSLCVHIGRADRVWKPLLSGRGEAADRNSPTELSSLLHERVLSDSPVEVTLRFGAALGVVADKHTARAVARSIVCQAVNLLGPGALRLAVLAEITGSDDIADWSWVSLLPHARQPGSMSGAGALAGESTEVEAVLEEHERLVGQKNDPGSNTPRSAGPGRCTSVHLLVVEPCVLSDSARATLRRLVERGAVGGARVVVVALAPSSDLLPSFCSDVLTVADSGLGLGDLVGEGQPRRVSEILVALTPVDAAVQTTLDLCALRDPEAAEAGQNLPSTVPLLPLLGLGSTHDEFVGGLGHRWARGRVEVARSFRAILGASEDGPFAVDFVADGPHALVAGTTGSGKSELLRSLVASLAATYSPDDANIVLIDYKGGSAFDACAGLPHVVGLVTDLDERLGERALVSLEAELRRRELLLRNAGAPDFVSYRGDATNVGVPLPRLMVVIDEFASMARELPDFLSALIGIAQRGRSLGVHMLLATQRPAGVLNENIAANTNLRIALRVQDVSDSHDVIGSPLAAAISRHLPGRAFARLGPAELVKFHAARIPSSSQPPETQSASLERPRVHLSVGGPLSRAPSTPPSETIEDLIAAVGVAWHREGAVKPRRPWLDPLPTELRFDALPAHPLPDNAVAVGLLDDPSRQEQRPYLWTRSAGNVALCGVSGSGRGNALLAFAHQLASRFAPNDTHLYGLDFGDGVLGALRELPHTGAVVGPTDRDRLVRLVRLLRQTIEDRRSNPSDETDPPLIAVFIDNIAGALAAIDEVGPAARDDLARLIADGPGVGVCFFVAGDRPGAFPLAVAAALGNKIVFRMADHLDIVQFGVDRKFAPPAIDGRALSLPERLAVQMLSVGSHDFTTLADRWRRPARAGPAPTRRPQEIRSLPVRVDRAEFGNQVRIDPGGWFLPIGLSDESLEAAGFLLRAGEHVLITGPSHAGKSTTLHTVAELAASAGASVSLLALRPSPVSRFGSLTSVCEDRAGLRTFVEKVRAHSLLGPHLLLIDDAELIDDQEGLLSTLATDRIEGLRIVVAARGDVLRSRFGHWTVEIRRSRIGLILRPVPDLDGDLWFTALPRKGPTRFRDGLGYLVASGSAQLVQSAI